MTRLHWQVHFDTTGQNQFPPVFSVYAKLH